MLSALDRKIFVTWTRGTFRREKRNPRIAIVGNCQTLGVAYGMKVLVPDGAIDFYQVQPRTWASIELLAETLKNYDYAFCCDFPNGFVRGGNSDALQKRVARMMRFPLIAFAGFHPDIIGIEKASNGLLSGPMGPYHSAIVLLAFLAGFSIDEAEALFDRTVFQKLGYFDVWDSACKLLLAHAEASGVDLSSDLLRWSRRGCFMHTVNHPKAFVLFDIARALLMRIGICPAPVNFDDYAIDPLASDFVWPVYTPIAESLDLQGSYLFRQRRADRRNGAFFGLRQFVTASFHTYASVQRAQLANARVTALLDDEETMRLLQDVAARNTN